MNLHRQILFPFVVMVLLLAQVDGLRADSCLDKVRLEVGSIYEWAGKTNVAVRLTNVSGRRLMIGSGTEFHGIGGIWYSVRPHDITCVPDVVPRWQTPLGYNVLLDPGHSSVAEVWIPYRDCDIRVELRFVPAHTRDTCLVGINARVPPGPLPVRISRERAVQIASEAGFPFAVDSEWVAKFTWWTSLGRVWELKARVDPGNESRGPVDTLAFVDAFSGRFLGFGSIHAGIPVRQ